MLSLYAGRGEFWSKFKWKKKKKSFFNQFQHFLLILVLILKLSICVYYTKEFIYEIKEVISWCRSVEQPHTFLMISARLSSDVWFSYYLHHLSSISIFFICFYSHNSSGFHLKSGWQIKRLHCGWLGCVNRADITCNNHWRGHFPWDSTLHFHLHQFSVTRDWRKQWNRSMMSCQTELIGKLS